MPFTRKNAWEIVQGKLIVVFSNIIFNYISPYYLMSTFCLSKNVLIELIANIVSNLLFSF